jgi:hypothetical protein
MVGTTRFELATSPIIMETESWSALVDDFSNFPGFLDMITSGVPTTREFVDDEGLIT